jgi:hypothetical protein
MFWRDAPPPGILLNFIDVFIAVLNLGTLNLERGFIDQELFRIKYVLIGQGKIKGIDGAHAALFKFRFLLQDIGILLAANSTQSKGLIDKLIKSPMQQYYGTRLEIHIAAFLSQKSITYTCPDPPDFLINTDQASISIECTSRNLTVKKDKDDVIKGFITAIRNKSNYSFVNGNAGLFIDSTNLAFNNGSLFWEEYEATREFLKTEIEKTNFGSVLTFSWIWNTSNDRYEAVYSRIDSDRISNELQEFLNLHYPLGTHTINPGNANIPSIG